MVSAQKTNLLPKNASRNDAIFAQKVYRIYATTSQYLTSYGCTITMVHVHLYVCVVNMPSLSGNFQPLHAEMHVQ